MDKKCQDVIEIIDSKELHDMLENKNDQLLLVDVRQPKEYEQGHIPGSILIPLGQLELGHPSLEKKKKVATYCHSGKRSLLAANILCQMGFNQVMSLRGGITNWKYELLTGPPGRPLTPEEIKSTLDILMKAFEKEYFKYNFYTSKKEEVTIEEIKGLLEKLAAWEKEHFNTIYQKYVSWSDKQGLTPKSQEEIKNSFGDVLTSKGKSYQEDPTKGSLTDPKDPVELLEKAVEEEFEAYDFYKVSGETMKDEEIRSLLLELSFEERSHAFHLLGLIPGYIK